MHNKSKGVDKIVERTFGMELMANEGVDCFMIRVVSVDMPTDLDSDLLKPNPCKCPAMVSYGAAWA
jgi:hypothetical protein